MKRGVKTRDQRCGFALLTVIGVIAGCVVLGLLIVREAQATISTAANRKAYTLARWRALDCIERSRGALDYEREAAMSDGRAWSTLDAFLKRARIVTDASDCSVRAQALGDQVDVNTVSAVRLRQLFLALDLPPSTVDTLLDSLLDWRDEDSEPRQFGAEAEWYSANGRVIPRNGALGSSRELALIRGFDDRPHLMQYFATRQNRVSLAHSPRAVLLSLPGFTNELVDEIIRRRSASSLPSEVFHLASALSEGARDTLMSHQGNLAGRLAPEPDGWVLTSRGRITGSLVTCVLEVTLTRVGSGTQVIEYREWWE